MRIALFALVTLFVGHPSTADALTLDENVTAKYVREHPDHISVAVVEKENGILSFTVGLKLKESRYVVAHMKVRDDSRTLSESHTPTFTRTEKSTFHFSIPREFIGTSTYSLGVGHFLERPGREPVPIPGSIRYIFRLSEFPVSRRPANVPTASGVERFQNATTSAGSPSPRRGSSDRRSA